MSGQDSTPRAAVYHRVAHDRPETPDGQLEAIQQYAQAHGYEILPPYTADAPEAGLVITDAELGHRARATDERRRVPRAQQRSRD